MRLQDFDNEYEPKPKQRLFCWTINIRAKAMSRLSPFNMNDITVAFPILNATTANLRNIQMKGTGDCGQLIAFTIDIAVFATSEAESMRIVLEPTLLDVTHKDGQLTLIEPEVTIGGESVLPEV
ncbi:hypothetical protein GCM10011332_31900 [Terasakiella brassicae]|uniref:Uncharacterized protein n=1 Tax=Terasakiella brassicae TaxID=1634917 RepID=A0A917CAG9_9PROT|nr:hypothetical protein [Terasakiella brassicae]GGF75520.1 hypothetical protein GCM10011332_31900 [Terasakiella brassicae]